MSESLQDQLKALGLAREKKKGSSKSSGHGKKGGKPTRRKGGAGGRGEMSLDKAYALKRRDEHRQADKARKKKQAEDRQRRLLNNQIRDIVKAGRLNSDDAELPRNFLFKGRIRKINVTPEQLRDLNTGKLGIVYLSGGYHLLAPADVEKVKALSSDHVVELDSGDSEADGDYPVPDDLNW